MLYIGSSVIDVATEIDVKDINNLKVSVVRLPDNNFKIYDLRCSILDVYTEISFNNMTESEKRTYTSSDFFKMILASVCSFQKKSELKGYSFCEEYIIPQILALILKIIIIMAYHIHLLRSIMNILRQKVIIIKKILQFLLN